MDLHKPLARSEALDSGCDGGVDESLLSDAIGVILNNHKRENSMDALKDLLQLSWVVKVDLEWGCALDNFLWGKFLSGVRSWARDCVCYCWVDLPGEQA